MSGNKSSCSVSENSIDRGDGKLVHKALAVKEYLNSDDLKSSSDRLGRVRGYFGVRSVPMGGDEQNEEQVILDDMILVGDAIATTLHVMDNDKYFESLAFWEIKSIKDVKPTISV